MPAQCTLPFGTRIAGPSTLRVPGATVATGAPPVLFRVQVVLDVLHGMQGLLAEHAREALEHGRPPGGLGAQPVVAPGAAPDEREEHFAAASDGELSNAARTAPVSLIPTR